ncbi:hypothetical protein KAR91_41890 [Candidatus Pacearchaeota archaeon]|nr:hypothetical protein [Candidatus Pacearchaeota archaeon]
MKAETFYLTSLDAISNVIARVAKIQPEEKLQVTISNTGTKSARQRGLDWFWNDDIAKAGIGGKHEDYKEGVHLVCKYRFAVPILCRDDEFFAGLYEGWLEKHPHDPEAVMWFVEHHVSTEALTVSQMAEYLTAKQHYYLDKGVNLTDPQFRGLLD